MTLDHKLQKCPVTLDHKLQKCPVTLDHKLQKFPVTRPQIMNFSPVLLQLTVFLGWSLSISALLFAIFGGFPFQQPDYKYNAIWSALYSSTYHTVWALGVGWVVLACESDHGGKRSCLLYAQYPKF